MLEFIERIFSPLTNLLGSGLELFHAQGAPWWLSIALLTIIVRSILFPLTIRQVKSMRAMQDLKPDMDRLRAKYKDNKQKQQEELMKLYQERKVNPFGSCLPILIQMPIFISVYVVVRSFGETHESFNSGGILWFQDLSVQDPFYILPVISAVTMLAASEITSKSLDPQQRWMMRLLPVGFTVFLISFPAGLFMYWITSNLVTLVQNYLIYNYGPGKRSSDTVEKHQASVKAESGIQPAATSQNGEAEDVQKARSTKRKRRKKKK
jgi:YidC/Oxa1 family membrane protein insertase